MPPNFPSLKIKGMKIDSKNRQQNKRPDNFETVLKLINHQKVRKLTAKKGNKKSDRFF